MRIPSFSSPFRLFSSILNTRIQDTNIGNDPISWGARIALYVTCFPAIEAQRHFSSISNEQDIKEILQSRKWVIITLSLSSAYIIASDERFRQKFPFIKFNPIEAVVASPIFLHKYYCSNLGPAYEVNLITTSKIWLVSSSLLIYREAKDLYSELKPIIEKSDNFITQTSIIAIANFILIIGYDFFIAYYFSIESEYSSLFDLSNQSDTLVNYLLMKSILERTPLLKRVLSIHTLAVLLSHTFTSVGSLSKNIYETLQLVTELESWRNTLPVSTGVNTEKVFRNTLRSIYGFTINSNSLDLSDCKLKEVPPFVWKLKHTYELNLNNNQLDVLPPEIARLEKLELLHLSGNRSLNRLPEAIRELTQLTDIFATNTRVDPDQVEELLRDIRWRRASMLSAELTDSIKKWKELAGITDDSLTFTETLESHEKGIIADWLKRLEQTTEFKSGRKSDLAKIIVSILKTLNEDPSFKKDFFTYVEVNNTSCEDRAAMSLNEIYVLWVVSTLERSKNTSLADKVRIYLRAVMTYTFRYYISEWIQANKPQTSESVEIFLFYETLLRHKLGLLSPVSTMEHPTIGHYLDVLPEEKVIEDVKRSYLNNIFKYPAFETLIEKDPMFSKIWSRNLADLESEMEELDVAWRKRKAQIKDNVELAKEEAIYTKQSKAIQKKYNEAKKKSAFKWLKQKGFIKTTRS
ncbi:MAG: hypothetical protein GWP59_05140 [Chlamydiales bacterium]|nr:hypothetical protein [Chlamydiales bacterium]